MSRRALITAVASLLLLALTSLMGCVVAAPYHDGGHGRWHGHHRPAPWVAPYRHGGWHHGHWR
ncbi:MAG: hypothetical protein HY910_17570 [Desulfarculus sp.]|nr:hypothetical protein [Desulfarculus sp.]